MFDKELMEIIRLAVVIAFNSATALSWFYFSRICFLETVAGVPGMVAAMIRHMRSLRLMQRDYGWIHTLLGKMTKIVGKV